MKKHILIIGGTGFIGYHMADFLIKKNYQVLSISRSKPKRKRKLKKVKYIYVDISKKKLLQKKIKAYRSSISYIINLGGEIDHKSYKKVHESHYIGLKNLADIFLSSNIKRFVQVGSSMEYGKYKSPHVEKKSSQPLSYYGKAKYKATKYLISISKKYKFPSVVLRPYQVYGPQQNQDRLIPFVINSCIKNKKFPCSSGVQKRDFLYIADFVEAVEKLLITKKQINGEIFNIGSGRPHKVKNVIQFIESTIKKGHPIFGKIDLRKEENLVAYPSILKLKKMISWKPKVKFEKGIVKTINYYKKNI